MHRIIAYMVIAAVSLGFLFYPQANSWNHERQQIAAQVNSAAIANRTGGAISNELLDAAHEYNKSLRTSDIEYYPAAEARHDAVYNEQLRVGRNPIMGEVIVPAIDVRLPIYHGTSDAVLKHGAGHVYGTSLPVGGESTHSVISAHAGIPGAEMFRHLNELVVGDEFYVSVSGQTLRYVVDQIEVIEPTDLDDVRIVPGEDYVTLLTCTPIGINSHRLLVRGAYAGLGAIPPRTAADLPFPWFAVWYVAGLTAAALLAYVITKKTRQALPQVIEPNGAGLRVESAMTGTVEPAMTGTVEPAMTGTVESAMTGLAAQPAPTPAHKRGRHLAMDTALAVALTGVAITLANTHPAVASSPAPSGVTLTTGSEQLAAPALAVTGGVAQASGKFHLTAPTLTASGLDLPTPLPTPLPDATTQGTLEVIKHSEIPGQPSDTEFILTPIRNINGKRVTLTTAAGWQAVQEFTLADLALATLGDPVSQTTSSGSTTFENLTTGLYLVTETIDTSKMSDPKFRAEDFLVTIPFPGTNDKSLPAVWQYEITAEPKVLPHDVKVAISAKRVAKRGAIAEVLVTVVITNDKDTDVYGITADLEVPEQFVEYENTGQAIAGYPNADLAALTKGITYGSVHFNVGRLNPTNSVTYTVLGKVHCPLDADKLEFPITVSDSGDENPGNNTAKAEPTAMEICGTPVAAPRPTSTPMPVAARAPQWLTRTGVSLVVLGAATALLTVSAAAAKRRAVSSRPARNSAGNGKGGNR